MPKILPDGTIVRTTLPNLKLPPKTDGKRRLDNWLGAFLDYTIQAECPLNYLRWAGLSTIAAAAQRKIYMETPYFFAHSNMFVVLVGPPGTKKSTAIRAGRKLLKQLPDFIHLSSDAPSVVGIMQDFKDIAQKQHQSLNAFIGELSTLYENAQETMTGFLTHMYDGDPDYVKRTRAGGKEHIQAPWLNLIAGTTPSWLGQSLPKGAIEGGLVARTIYVYSAEEIVKSPWPEFNPELRELEKLLVHDLAHISQLTGEFTFAGGKAGDAYRWYDTWYRNLNARRPMIADNRTAGYYVRKPIHLLKVSMAISLSKSDKMVLDEEDLHVALALLQDVEPGMTRAFSAVGGNIYATELERVQYLVDNTQDGVTYGELVAATYHNMEIKNLDGVLTALKAMGRVKVGITPNGEALYRPRR